MGDSSAELSALDSSVRFKAGGPIRGVPNDLRANPRGEESPRIDSFGDGASCGCNERAVWVVPLEPVGDADDIVSCGGARSQDLARQEGQWKLFAERTTSWRHAVW